MILLEHCSQILCFDGVVHNGPDDWYCWAPYPTPGRCVDCDAGLEWDAELQGDLWQEDTETDLQYQGDVYEGELYDDTQQTYQDIIDPLPPDYILP